MGLWEEQMRIQELIKIKLFAEDKMNEESMHANIFVTVVIYYFCV